MDLQELLTELRGAIYAQHWARVWELADPHHTRKYTAVWEYLCSHMGLSWCYSRAFFPSNSNRASNKTLRSLSLGLRGSDLRGLDLSKSNLHRVDLSKTDLRGVNLTRANLSHSILLKADLRGVDLSQTHLDNALFDHTTRWPQGFDPTQTRLFGPGCNAHTVRRVEGPLAHNPADPLRNHTKDPHTLRVDPSCFKYIDFRYICGAGLRFSNLDLSHANLSHCDLSYTHLHNVNLSHADLSYTNLSHARLARVTLTYSDLSHCDLSHTYCVKTDLSHARCDTINLSHAYLHNDCTYPPSLSLDPEQTLGPSCNLTVLLERHHTRYLQGLDLSGCFAQDADLSRCDLQGTNLTGADLLGANLDNALYDDNTQWPEGFDPARSGALGPGADLRQRVVYRQPDDLRRADLRGADLSNIDPQRIRLEDARFNDETRWSPFHMRFRDFDPFDPAHKMIYDPSQPST